MKSQDHTIEQFRKLTRAYFKALGQNGVVEEKPQKDGGVVDFLLELGLSVLLPRNPEGEARQANRKRVEEDLIRFSRSEPLRSAVTYGEMVEFFESPRHWPEHWGMSGQNADQMKQAVRQEGKKRPQKQVFGNDGFDISAERLKLITAIGAAEEAHQFLQEQDGRVFNALWQHGVKVQPQEKKR